MKKKILVSLVAILVLIQLVRIDKTNPTYTLKNDFIEIVNPDADIAAIIKSACYDCHSNQSKYPWYSNVAPVSWLVKNHINEGREHFNFSEWGSYSAEDRKDILKECAEEVEAGVMPMKAYVLLHAEAKLSSEQKKKLVSFFNENAF